jgi:hypothetical protein
LSPSAAGLGVFFFAKGDFYMHDIINTALNDGDDKNINIVNSQHISKAFLESNRIAREDSKGHREGEYMRVASVPVIVHEQWLREGFDMMQESASAILKRLQAQDLHAFITTKKAV